MRPPAPLAKLGATLAGALKGLAARLRPRGAGGRSLNEAPAALPIAVRLGALREALGRAPRPLLIAGVAALALGLALSVIAALGASKSPEAQVGAFAGSGYEFFDELALPPPLPGELPFPLARPRKLRYTDADAAALSPRTWRFDVEALRARRVAELESLYDSLP